MRLALHAVALVVAGLASFYLAAFIVGCSSSSSSSSTDAGADVAAHRDAGSSTDARREAVALEHADAGADVAAHRDAGSSTDARREAVALEHVDAGSDVAAYRDAGSSLDARPDVVAHHHPDAGYCYGPHDGGYLPRDDSGFPWQRFTDAALEAGGACVAFGCWYECADSGPCPQSSTCATGLACLASADAADFDNMPGKCVNP